MPISKVHSSYGGNNKGSSILLANYLDKENQELDKIASREKSNINRVEIQERKQDFFNHKRSDISKIEVVDIIDNNNKKLSKNDSKFFSPTINFSENELKHLSKMATGEKEISNVSELNAKEFKEYNRLISEYTKKAMDNYANNFNRQEKGLNSGKDLVYFAKIEHSRKYKGTDKEVKNGIVKAGENKPGLQTHVHIIISRKDKTQKLKLTPTSNERNKVRKIGNNVYRVGFDRKAWILKNEKKFDSFFKYKRPLKEKVVNQNILKNGSPEEKEHLTQKIIHQKDITIENKLEL